MHPAAWRRLHTHTPVTPSPLITPTHVLPGTSIITSGFTNSRDRRPTSCRLVVSVVHHSSVGLAEWWADLQNLHPRLFLKFQSLCKLSNPRYTAYIIQYVFTVDCSFTRQSECVTTVSWALWSQWAYHMSVRLLCHYGGRWLAWLVSPRLRLGERTRQQARKLHTGRLRTVQHCAQCLVWMLRPVDSLVQRSCDGRGGASDHGGSDALSPPRCCQSLHPTLSTTDAFFLTPFSLMPRGLAALHVQLLSEIHSTQAWLFISLVLHGKWDLDPRTVHIRKN